MPNPKRRHSKTRTAKRRTHDTLKPVPVGTCPQCQEAKAPHQVCAQLRLLQGPPGQGRRRSASPLRLLRCSAVECASPSTPWAAMTPPAASSTARWSRRVTFRSVFCWSATVRGSSASCRGIPASAALDVDILDTPGMDRGVRAGGGGAAAQAARVDPPGGRSGPRRPRGGAVQRRPHRRHRDGGASPRSAGCPASIVPPSRPSSPRGCEPAVLLDSGATVECRPQHLVQFALMGAAYARVALGCRPRGSGCSRSARRRARATS